MKAPAGKKAADGKAPEAKHDNGAVAIEGSELGEVMIHENVIASLVARATLSVEGVSRLAGNTFVDAIAEIVGNRRMQARSISVEMGDNRVAVEIKLIILFGFTIPEVAPKVQKAVIEQVEKVTGMTVTKVGVIVQEMEEAPPEPTEEDAEIDSIPMN